MIYLLHHLIALLLGAGLIMVLLRGRWPDRAPGRTIAVWHCALLTVWGATAGMIFGPLVATHDRGIVPALIETTEIIFSTAPASERLGHLTIVLPGSIFVLGSVAVLVGGWVRMNRNRRRLRRLLDLVGDPTRLDPAIRIDSPTPAAWCLPGWRPRIVITSATVELLTPAELRAVIRHERAHLRQRHDLALLPFQALCALLPHSALVAAMHRRVHLLTEMLADDHALRSSSPADLARALTVLGDVGPDPTPRGALGATTGTSAATRARLARLRHPTAGTPGLLIWALLAAATALGATPVSLFLLPG
jgi:Zn-dependent protease with chaperone function